MSFPRVIPCLLLGKDGLIKTEQFGKERYIGDPMNTVRIFNEKEVDELTLLDIRATAEGRAPNLDLIKRIATECRMPLTYGGGIKDYETAEKIISIGVEKVSLSSAALEDISIVRKISESLGSQSTAVCIDYVRGWGGRRSVRSHNGRTKVKGSLHEYIARVVEAGAGELILYSISDDGMMKGYDLELAEQVSSEFDIPMTFVGGAGSHGDIKDLFAKCGNVGAGVGSLFVYKGGLKGVLINYPNQTAKEELWSTY